MHIINGENGSESENYEFESGAYGYSVKGIRLDPGLNQIFYLPCWFASPSYSSENDLLYFHGGFYSIRSASSLFTGICPVAALKN